MRAESPHFIVYSAGSEEQLREQVLLLEDFDSLLRLMTGRKGGGRAARLAVYVVSGRRHRAAGGGGVAGRLASHSASMSQPPYPIWFKVSGPA